MAELDDLKTAVAETAQADLDVAQGLKDVSAKLSTPGIDPAEVESLAQQLKNHADSLEASAKGLEAAAGVQVSGDATT